MEEAPKLFYEDPKAIVARLKAWYENETGKTVLPSQPEFMFINMVAYVSAVFDSKLDSANAQNFSRFSSAPVLDYLGENVAVDRLDAVPAVTTVRYALVAGHGTVTIPAGSRVATKDQRVMFATDIEAVIPPGTDSVEIHATATMDGPAGNGYGAGTVTEIVDPLPFVESAVNIVETSGGADQESDENYRERIKLGNSQYSTGGSVEGYQFFARSASALIIDVAVISPIQGQVEIYPLVRGGIETPQAILDAVRASTSGDRARPIGDTVTVLSPTPIEYELNLNITLKYGAPQTPTVDRIIADLTAYCNEQSRKLGADITFSQLTAAAMNENVHSIDFVEFGGLGVNPTEFAVCTQIGTGWVAYEDPNY